VSIEAYGSLMVALFWSFTNSIMDLEQAKGGDHTYAPTHAHTCTYMHTHAHIHTCTHAHTHSVSARALIT